MAQGNALNATLLNISVITVRSLDGVDQPNRGSDIRPYKTIAYALSQTTFVATNLYVIDCYGSFTEAFPALIPNLVFKGNGGSLRITNQLTLAGSWSGNSGYLIFDGFSSSLDFALGMNLNFSSSPFSMFKVQNSFITKEVAGWTLTGNGSNQNLSGIYIDYLPAMAPSITQTNMIILNSNTIFSVSAPLTLIGTTLGITQSSGSTDGYLSSADWTTFNSKQAAGNYITSLTGEVTASGPGASVATITANAVTNAKLAQMSAFTMKGNNTASPANAKDLTVSEVQVMINGASGVLGTMAYQNAISVAITGGTIGGVAISGGTINNTPIGGTIAADGKFTTLSASTSITNSAFGTAGVVHNDSSGLFSSSLIVNADIANNTISNTKMANMANLTFKGNVSGVAAPMTDLTVAQMQAALGTGGSTPLTATQIGFGSASNTLTGDPTLTWNNTTKTLLANSTITVAAPAGTSLTYVGVGGGVNGPCISIENVANTWMTGSAVGDMILRNQAAGKRILLGANGFGVPSLIIDANICRTSPNGGISFGNSTSGYVAGTLDYYETAQTVTGFNMIGPWTPIATTLTFMKIGPFVVMKFTGTGNLGVLVTNASQNITFSNGSTSQIIPARFRPSVDTKISTIEVYDGTTNLSRAAGTAQVNANGQMFFYPNNSATAVFGSTYAGVSTGFIYWFTT